MSIIRFFLLFFAISAVAVADVLFKKASEGNDFFKALIQPASLLGIGLYLFQIVFFIYLFSKKTLLVDIGIYTTFLYAAITIGSGLFLYQEKITSMQYLGIGIALIGTFIFSYHR